MEKNNNNSNNIIELKNIVKTYDNGFTAVDGFNLEVKRGEFVTFLGPSGCGKTTTLRMIAGFEIPTSGEILLDGQDISKLPPNKRPINTVFQRYALFPHLNIFDNIAFGLKLKKLPKAEIVKKVKKVLEMVDLEGFEDRKVGKKGVVRELSTHIEVVEMIVGYARSIGFRTLHLSYSPIKGPEGNIEYLLHISKDESKTDEEFDIKALVEESHNELNKS